MVFLFLSAAVGYLIGSIPFGYLVARTRGVNIFAQGSGNIGATNVGRVLGRRFGILVFLLDFAKGAAPVALAGCLVEPHLAEAGIPLGSGKVLAGLAAFLGHLFPVFLGFRGGKGVATGAGVVSVLTPGPALAAMLVWLVVVTATRYVSLASVAAALVLPGAYLLLSGPIDWKEPTTWFVFLAAVLVVVKHTSNLKRLFLGAENRLPEDSTVAQLGKFLHVWALAIWLGSMVFFTIAGQSLFSNFEKLGEAKDRPGWFPATEKYQKQDQHIDGPKEQGSRVAGFAVSPMFPVYFLVQGICAFIALGTCLPWGKAEPHKRVHKWRGNVLFMALVTVIMGWPVEQRVTSLRLPRNLATDAYLQAKVDNGAVLSQMQEARSEFRLWHFFSLGLNLATMILVGIAVALTVHIPHPTTRVFNVGPDRGEERTEIVALK